MPVATLEDRFQHMNFYPVHGTVLSKNIFIYLVLWAFPPYSSVSTFSIHAISFLCALGSFPFTVMSYVYSCFMSIYILRGQFGLCYGWWGIRICLFFLPPFFSCQAPPWIFSWLILPRFQNFSLHYLSGLRSPFAVRRWPLICFVLYSDGLASLVITCSFSFGCLVIMNFSMKLILSRLGSKVWHQTRA